MKYCEGKYHGDVQKMIDDNEEYCLICRQRMAGVKEEKTKKAINNGLKILQLFSSVVLPLGTLILFGKSTKGGGKSKSGGKSKA